MKDVVKQINEVLGQGMSSIQDLMLGDAVKMLKMDHRKVKGLFIAYKIATDPETKQHVINQICLELKVHSQLEEEIVYPALRMIEKGELLVDEANIEHRLAKDLVEELESTKHRGTMLDAKVKVLRELVEHHIKEEERDMLPKLKEVCDLEVMGKEIEMRKAELLQMHSTSTKTEAKATIKPASKRAAKSTNKSTKSAKAEPKTELDSGEIG